MSQHNRGNQQSEDNEYISETCEAILDTAKTIYNEEAERFKQTEAKTNITLAFVGILFAAYLTYLGAFKPISKEISYLVYTFLFELVIFILFVLSIVYFFKSIKTEEYEQVGLENIVNENLARNDANQTKLLIAATYKDAIDFNKNLLESKLKLYGMGLNFMHWGFLSFAVHFMIEEVIKYVK
ncbi:hypothetical protein [Priestia megaterium]|uniref:hypothetical protein n=1 Tax=Priestia megaterium TaxID=1404 RepID=UPI002E22C2BA|nr:hypothetical protein [Priestia megaterium]